MLLALSKQITYDFWCGEKYQHGTDTNCVYSLHGDKLDTERIISLTINDNSDTEDTLCELYLDTKFFPTDKRLCFRVSPTWDNKYFIENIFDSQDHLETADLHTASKFLVYRVNDFLLTQWLEHNNIHYNILHINK